MAIDFATNLQTNLEAQPRLRFRGRRLLRFLQQPDSTEKQQHLVKLENHSKLHLGLPGVGSIDWSKIDWPTVIEGLLRFLLAILPVIIPLL